MEKNLFKNFSIVAFANLSVSFFSFLTFYFNANALGVKYFGILALYTTGVVVFDRLFTLDIWQSVIKYGGRYYHKKKFQIFRDILVHCFLKEFFLLLLSFIISNLLLIFVYKFYNFSTEFFYYGLIFSFTLLFRASNTSTGFFRLINRFDILAICKIFFSVTTLIFSIYFWYIKKDFINYIFLFSLTLGLQHLVIIVISVYFWKKNFNLSILKFKILDNRIKNKISKLSKNGWITSSLGVIVHNLDIYLLATFIDINTSGIYKFANSIASFILLLSKPLQQVFFPEILKMKINNNINAIRKIFKKIIFYGTIFLIISNILNISLSKIIIELIGGNKFNQAILPLIILYMAYSIRASAFYIRPILINIVNERIFLKSVIYPTILYVVCALVGVFYYGIIGICLAHLACDIFFHYYGFVKIKSHFNN